MNLDCEKCHGDGELECECCHQPKPCPACDGEGWIECCISEFPIPKHWKHRDALEDLKLTVQKVKADHAHLVSVNPKCKASYDEQLAKTLLGINAEAIDLEP